MTIPDALRKLKDAVRLRHFSLATEKAYCLWLQSYMAAVAAYPNNLTSEQKVQRFLTDEANRGISASTQNQALNALLFFYEAVLGTPLGEIDAARAHRQKHVRLALSLEEAGALLHAVEDVGGYPTRLVVWLLYGCGMRVTEPLSLRLKDVNLSTGQLAVRAAKGGKDRLLRLPDSLVDGMEAQMRLARAVWRGDVAAGLPVALPGLLAKRNPRLALSEGWAWVFPAHQPAPDPRTGEIARWRMHEVNVQRAVRAAAAKTGLSGRITPHGLRHSYATHAHQDGASARDLQELLGHGHLDTTMRYLSPEAARVASPLDRLVRRRRSGQIPVGTAAKPPIA
jgi:integron integrase